MIPPSHVLRWLCLLALAPMLSNCASVSRKTTATPSTAAHAPAENPAPAAATEGKSAATSTDEEVDEYAVVGISDPFERINRRTFWVNDKLYLVIFRPISKGYEKAIPQPLRKGIDNAYANAKYPVRLVNHALQGKFKRAGQETEKFLLNTVVGLGGAIRVSDKFPALAELPEQDTGMTFAKWGMGHGPYVVLPFLGPSSARDGIGLIGDYAMNPVNWGIFWGGDDHDWTMIPPYGNTLRALPGSLSLYDDAKQNAIDPYISIRNAYKQYRDEAIRK